VVGTPPPPFRFCVNGKKSFLPYLARTRLHTEVSFFSYRKDRVVRGSGGDSVEVKGSEG